MPIVPEDCRLHLRLNTSDLAEGSVIVQIVDGSGSEVWKGAAVIHHDRLDVSVPSLTEAGTHFLRVYDSSQGGLLREFAFRVR